MAPTSPAAKVNEESLTYLNQGQNYDLRLSYNNSCEPPNAEPKMLLTIVRLCFWDRKLQEVEEDEIQKVIHLLFTRTFRLPFSFFLVARHKKNLAYFKSLFPFTKSGFGNMKVNSRDNYV